MGGCVDQCYHHVVPRCLGMAHPTSTTTVKHCGGGVTPDKSFSVD